MAGSRPATAGPAARPAADGFEIGYVTEDGDELSVPLAQAWAVRFEHLRPVLIRDWSPKMDGITATIFASSTTIDLHRQPESRFDQAGPTVDPEEITDRSVTESATLT